MTKTEWHFILIGWLVGVLMGVVVMTAAYATHPDTPSMPPETFTVPPVRESERLVPLAIYKESTQSLYVQDSVPDTARLCLTGHDGQPVCVTVGELRERRD